MEKQTSKQNRKSSLSRKLLASMLLVVIISTLASVAMNRILLGPYYYYRQSKILERTADSIDAFYSGELSEATVQKLNQLGYNLNGLILIYDQEGAVLYSSRAFQGQVYSVSEETTMMGRRRPLFDGTRIGIVPTQSGDGGTPSWRSPLITVEKELGNGDTLFLQTSESALAESVGIINQFSLYPALVAILAAVFLSMFLTKRISRPVVELTEITKRMKALDFSNRYEGNADDEIGELGRNFNDMAQTLDTTIGELNRANVQLLEDIEREKAIEEARKNFISNVSHELKTPISLIRGYAEGIRDQVIEPQDFEEYLGVIIEESEHMSSMVRELLTLSKLESHHAPVHFEEVDVLDLVERVLEMFSFEMQKEEVSLERDMPDHPTRLVCDQNMLETILTNYVSNAMDHVEGEKRIRIQVQDDAQTVEIRVFNTGKPIPGEELDKIWDSFYKIDKARTRAYGGTGLGLAIVKNMVQIHKGDYGVQNARDGVWFFVRLPKVDKHQ